MIVYCLLVSVWFFPLAIYAARLSVDRRSRLSWAYGTGAVSCLIAAIAEILLGSYRTVGWSENDVKPRICRALTGENNAQEVWGVRALCQGPERSTLSPWLTGLCQTLVWGIPVLLAGLVFGTFMFTLGQQSILRLRTNALTVEQPPAN